VTFGRIGSAPFVDRTIEPSSEWQLTSIEFAGRDNQAPPATLELRFSASGTPPARVLLDDVDLRAATSAATAFRSEVIAALRALHPGYLRDWQGQLGDTLINRLAPDFGRHPSRYRPGNETQFAYSLPDFLDLCARVGARPWVVVPPTFSDAELVGLGKFLAAENGSRRFDRIAVEFGNENWNGIFRPAAIPNPETYGGVADRAFRLIREGAGNTPIRTLAPVWAGTRRARTPWQSVPTFCIRWVPVCRTTSVSRRCSMTPGTTSGRPGAKRRGWARVWRFTRSTCIPSAATRRIRSAIR
jgi:hypothetical protein